MAYCVRVTIVKREYYSFLDDCPPEHLEEGKCTYFREGQEFIVTRENFNSFPENHSFCTTAWSLLKTKIYAAFLSQKHEWEGWNKEVTKQFLCCSNGIHPVVFLLERIDTEC